jgi:hypothetical protein
VDPSNGNIVYAAADNGVYRSTDGGLNWSRGLNAVGTAQSLALDATSPAANRILFTGINGSGIRRSTNGGASWTQVLSATTPAVATALLSVTNGIGRVIVELAPPTSPPNPAGIQVLYATMESTGGGAPDPLGLFESTDQGATWTQRTATGMPSSTQGGFSMAMGVDPASPGDGTNDILYVGMVGYGKSTDSGNSFSPTGSGMHVDFHANFVFGLQPSPNPSIVFAGNDGGIWKSTDGGANWSGAGGPAPTINAGGLQTALFYNLDVKRDATASVTEGTLQDNGGPRTTGSMAWTDTMGGDGFGFAFETANPANAYMSSGFWDSPSCTRVFQSTDSGAGWGNISDGKIPVAELDCVTAAGKVHPVSTDPNNSGTVYVGGVQSVFQSTDGGGSFRNVNNFSNRISDVNVAPANSQNVVVGLNNGQVWVSVNARAATVGPPSGVVFSNITRNLPSRLVMRVMFDPNDPTVVYTVLGGFGTGHIFRTSLGASGWTDLSPPIDIPFNAIALDGASTPTTIYVGTDLGVLRSADGGASWTTVDDLHFPNVPVTALAFNPQAGVLRAATFGRGAFQLTAPNGPVIAVNAQNGLAFGQGCAGVPENLTLQVFNVGTSNLVINSVARLMGSTNFTVLPNPATPLIISPNAEVDFTIQYNPDAARGPQQATIRVSSSDPGAPFFDLTATGFGTNAVATVTGSADFGNVCAGTLAEKTLSVCNVGACDLHVLSAAFRPFCPDFTLINNPFPATISPNFCLNLPIQLTPSSCGPKTCTLAIITDDPHNPTNIVTVTANTPCPSIDVPPDLGFLPEVIQSAGTCNEPLPFPISNKGQCNLTITGITLGGTNASDYFISGLPSFPVILQPGDIVGAGNLNVVFAPTQVARERSATITVTYISDPLTGATNSVTRNLCGEGVLTGARVLVMQGGVPVPLVEKMQLQRINANRNKGIIDTQDVAQNLPLVTVIPDPPCEPFQYHREYGTVSNPIQLLPGDYQVTASAIINGKRKSQTVGFSVNTCDFDPTVVINF